MNNYEFGLKAMLPSTRGVKSSYHEADYTKRLFVSLEETKSGKSKGKFRLTEGAMKAFGFEGKDGKIIPVSRGNIEFLLANVTAMEVEGTTKVSKIGTFYDLKLFNALQTLGFLPENVEVGQEFVFDMKIVDENPFVVRFTPELNNELVEEKPPVEEEVIEEVVAYEEDDDNEEEEEPYLL